MQAVEAVAVSLMPAAFVYVACQVLDLRAMNIAFLSISPTIVTSTVDDSFGRIFSQEGLAMLVNNLEKHMANIWSTTTKLEASARCQVLVDTSMTTILQALLSHKVTISHQNHPSFEYDTVLDNWKAQTHTALVDAYHTNRTAFCHNQHTEELLGLYRS